MVGGVKFDGGFPQCAVFHWLKAAALLAASSGTFGDT